jgi:hypothetical protein
LKSKSDGDTANAQNLDQVASLERGRHNGESHKKAKEHRGSSRQPGEYYAQILAVPGEGSSNDPADNQAKAIEGNENNNRDDQRGQSQDETLDHVPTGFPKFRQS